MFFSALFTLLAANMMIESKELICAETDKTKSTLVAYHAVSGKKGASGMTGFKGVPGEINKQELEKLEGKKFVLSLIMRQSIFDNFY